VAKDTRAPIDGGCSPSSVISTPASFSASLYFIIALTRSGSSWTSGGKEFSEEAILTVRSDRVYIFRANADESNRQRATHALEALLETVRWQ